MGNKDQNDFDSIAFDLPKNQSNVIKVIGVGGGGSNAINHMFRQGIKGVDFVVCNTDAQALENSPVPIKIQLGVNLTEGLGAGANPDVGEQAALESYEDLKNLLGTNTKMVFITAGMGGGTGTGAAPVIAKQAKEMDILTVGIVTSPFLFEGKTRNEQAQVGVEKLRREVDSLIVINNNKLREVYGNLGFKAGFSKADEVLATASRGIAEVITHHYTQNIDLKDAKTVLSNSGTAIMGSAVASGSNRSKIAIEKALDSPLLNDNKIKGAQNVLLLIVSGTDEITLDEIGEINDHIQEEAGNSANIIMGVGEDESLDDSISVTIIATGFNSDQQDAIVNTETKKIIHTLDEEQKVERKLQSKPFTPPLEEEKPKAPSKIVHQLEDNEEEDNKPKAKHTHSTLKKNPLIPTTEAIKGILVEADVFDFEEDDFEIKEVQKKEDEKQDNQDQELPFTFDLPLNTSSSKVDVESSSEKKDAQPEKPKQIFQLGDEIENINDIEVYGEIDLSSSVQEESKPQHKVQETKIHTYQLGDYEDEEGGKPKKVAEPKPIDEEVNFRTRVEETAGEEKKSTTTKEIDPMNSSIKDLSSRAEERRAKMKKFNYKFKNNQSLDEIERQPAYKRAGVEIDHTRRNKDAKISRTSLHKDENGEVNFRSNNSFLHDNVD
jgi:cell division protein FtsZ